VISKNEINIERDLSKKLQIKGNEKVCIVHKCVRNYV